MLSFHNECFLSKTISVFVERCSHLIKSRTFWITSAISWCVECGILSFVTSLAIIYGDKLEEKAL